MRKKFEDTIMHQKGVIGERIADKLIMAGGKYVPYAPIIETSHPFDRLLVSRDKSRFVILEVKTINRRLIYPDTGISIAHRDGYLNTSNTLNIDVFILFVDALEGEAYGNYIRVLEEKRVIELPNGNTREYPHIEGNFTAVGKGIVYYPLEAMARGLHKLTDEEIAVLSQKSNHGYKQDLSHKKGYEEWKIKNMKGNES